MAVALDQFVKQLEDSGILAGDTLKDFIPPTASPKDAEELARELVRTKKLTKYQAEEAYKGKAKSLVLGNYVLMEKIGAGGMGQVFKAEHRRMKRIVAIKLLPTALTKDKAAIARFEREVEAAAKISHPNIVAAHDADCANGVHFLVMELVEGSDLSALVKKQGPLSVTKALNCIVQAAKGLEAAHKKGIVHRDIKPANLLIDKEGTVKILDMGLARLSADGDDAPQADLTSTGMIMGTVDYMAPEQALDTKTADARADIYALGCSLYFMLTGKATYDGDTAMKKLLAHRDQPIPSLRATRPEVTEQLEAVFTKMVAKKTDERYQTTTQLLVDLEKCCHEKNQTVATQQARGSSSDMNRDQSTQMHAEMGKSDQAQDRTVSRSQLLDSSSDTGLTDFLRGISAEPNPVVATKNAGKPPSVRNPNNWLMISGGVFGVILLLAGLLVKIKTKDGTLLVTVNEPDAEVQVLNEEGKVEITRKGDQGPITISVDPGKHRLKVTKEGFEFFTQDFTIESGGEQPITAKLVPLEEKPPALVTNPTLPTPVPAVIENPPREDGGRKPLAFETSGFDQWVKVVVGLPAEEQVKAVAQKMQELNSGFDGLMEPTIGEGIVLSIAFISDKVTDISPLRAFTNLSFLECNGSEPEKGMLADLSPLQGKSLRGVWCSNTKIADLSPLKDMPIKRLTCQFTSVSDLSPLSGMPLANLRCTATKVTDLSPLKGMQLSELQVEGTLITDLWALKGMHLTSLDFSGTPVSDITPLGGMPLVTLICSQYVTDLSPIKGMPLKMLSVDFKPERDTGLLRSIKTLETINLKPAADFWKEVEDQHKGKMLGFQMPGFDQWVKDVQAMPAEQQVEAVSRKLVELNPGFDGTVTPTLESGVVTGLQLSSENVADISPVRALEMLKTLTCDTRQDTGGLNDLSPLKGMNLTKLSCKFSQVSDLSPLTGMNLTFLNLHGAKRVSDLSPLKGMKLTWLSFGYSAVADIMPLQGMPLLNLYIGGTQVSDLTPLKGMPLTDFWCAGTSISDFSPLQGMPLTELFCEGTMATDLSWMKEMPLKDIRLDFKLERDTELLKSIKTLVSINAQPVAQFWKEVEEQQKGNKP